MNQEQLAAVAMLFKAMGGADMLTKAPANWHTGVLTNQPGGLFTTPGVDKVVVSTHIAPQGLGAILPAYPSRIDDPRYEVFTGFSDDIGDEAVNPCDDAPTGYIKAGQLTARFGRIMRDTNTIEVDTLLHQQRGAPTNLRLMGEMLGMTGMSMDMSTSDMLNLVVKSEMVSVAVRTERKVGKMVWAGTPANNTAGGGYKEFPGLDSQIATGHVDAETNTAIPSVDSKIYNFNYNSVGGTGLDIVEYLSVMEYQMRDLATRTGLDPVEWVFVMRPDLFWEVTSIWACRYLTNRCNDAAGNAGIVTINDDGAVRARDDMRNGMYLIVNGRRVRVIPDDGIFEHTNVNNANVPAGHYASSIYLVPLRVRSNFPVTYWEYINYRDLDAQLAALGGGRDNVPFWSDDGRFLWVYKPNGYCFKLQVKVEPRIVLRTPHLAAKLQNVLYAPVDHLRDAYPDSPYWVNGGVSTRTATSGNAVWA